MFIPVQVYHTKIKLNYTRKGIFMLKYIILYPYRYIKMTNISSFIKYQRKKLGITQEELASKAGVGLRFIRDLEQGKKTLQLDKVEQVYNLFGFRLGPETQEKDPYDIYWNHFNIPVRITLTNKLIKEGYITKELRNQDDLIIEWEFVSYANAAAFRNKQKKAPVEIIIHREIQEIENLV